MPLTVEQEASIKTHVIDNGKVIDISQLDGSENRDCVDGRTLKAIIGLVGGDLGALVMKATAIENASNAGLKLSKEQLQELFENHLIAYGSFYMHTDTHALQHAFDSLGEENQELKAAYAQIVKDNENYGKDSDELAAALESFIQNLDKKYHGTVINLLAQAGNIGCGHLNLLVKKADKYGVRAELVQDLIEIFYEKMLTKSNNHDKLTYKVLAHDHEEQMVIRIVMVDAQGNPLKIDKNTQVVMATPRVDTEDQHDEVFVDHASVIEYLLQHRIVDMISQSSLNMTDEEIAQAQTEVIEIYGHHTVTTVEELAPTLPIAEVGVHVTGNKQIQVLPIIKAA